MDRIEPTWSALTPSYKAPSAEMSADERAAFNKSATSHHRWQPVTLPEGDSIIADFGAAFETLLYEYIRWCVTEGYSDTTVKTGVFIRSTKETAARLIEAGIVTKAFVKH